MVKERISSQHVFGYMKYILYPEDYKPKTSNGKHQVRLPEVVGKGYGTFWRWKGRYRVCKGSRASKKSKTTALWYITNMVKYPDANLLVVRKTFRTLKDSCFTELKWAIHRLDVDAHWEIKESPLEMTYKPTGQKIYFRGLDDPLKVTSITVGIGCLCWMWIEEAYEISSEDDFNMLDEANREDCSKNSRVLKAHKYSTFGNLLSIRKMQDVGISRPICCYTSKLIRKKEIEQAIFIYNLILTRKAAFLTPTQENRNAAFFMPSCYAVRANKALIYAAIRARK